MINVIRVASTLSHDSYVREIIQIQLSLNAEYVRIFAMQDSSYLAPSKAMEDRNKGSRSIHAKTSRDYMCRKNNMPQDHFQTCTQERCVQ